MGASNRSVAESRSGRCPFRLLDLPMFQARYHRAPSELFFKTLLPNGPLHFLLQPWNVQGLPLDLQFRENDTIQLYCGLTSLLSLSLRGPLLTPQASNTYRQQPCAIPFFKSWNLGDPQMEPVLQHYLQHVQVEARWIRSEGKVQSDWSRIQTPWLPIDREAVIGYENQQQQQSARTSPELLLAFQAVEAFGWAKPGVVGAELDQLAIDEEGRLVLLELKDAAASKVYLAPLQLLAYVIEWSKGREMVREGVNRLVQKKRQLGLCGAQTKEWSGALRPVVAFGEDLRSQEARRRTEIIQKLVDSFLPEGSVPLEIWCLQGGVPRRIS